MSYVVNIDISKQKPNYCGKWYEDLWSKSVPFDLIEIFKKQLLLHQPYEIFLKILYVLRQISALHPQLQDLKI